MAGSPVRKQRSAVRKSLPHLFVHSFIQSVRQSISRHLQQCSEHDTGTPGITQDPFRGTQVVRTIFIILRRYVSLSHSFCHKYPVEVSRGLTPKGSIIDRRPEQMREPLSLSLSQMERDLPNGKTRPSTSFNFLFWENTVIFS